MGLMLALFLISEHFCSKFLYQKIFTVPSILCFPLLICHFTKKIKTKIPQPFPIPCCSGSDHNPHSLRIFLEGSPAPLSLMCVAPIWIRAMWCWEERFNPVTSTHFTNLKWAFAVLQKLKGKETRKRKTERQNEIFHFRKLLSARCLVSVNAAVQG